MKHLFIAVLISAALTGCSQQSDLPVYGSVPEFSLTERTNRVVTRQDLEGKVWIADFMFTECGGVCPIMTSQIRKLQDQLPREIHFVSVSVDPENDTPAVLTEYAERFGADTTRWLFLTGDRDAIYRLSIEGFKLAVSDTGGAEVEPITHSTRFALVDQQGRIRGYYGMDDQEAMLKLAADAQQLL